MDKIITFYIRHKEQILWAVVGVLAVLIAYFSIEALLGLIAILFGSQVHTSKKEQAKHRERVKEVVEQQQVVQQELDTIRQEQEKAVSQAESNTTKEVNDFLDGEWK